MTNANRKLKGYTLGVAECFIGAFTPLFSKFLSLSVPFLIWGRSSVAFVTLALILAITKTSPRLRSQTDFWIMLVGGFLMAMHWVTLFWAYRFSTVGMGIMALFTFPLMTTLLEPIIFKRKHSLVELLMSGLGFLGIVLIVPEFSFQSRMTIGVLFGVLSGFVFVIRTFIMSHYIVHYKSRVLMFYQMLFCMLCLSPIWLFSSFDAPVSELPLLVIMGVFFTFLPHTLLVKGLQYLRPTPASIIKYLVPVITLVYAYLFIGEVPTTKMILGGVIILGAGLGSMLLPKKTSD